MQFTTISLLAITTRELIWNEELPEDAREAVADLINLIWETHELEILKQIAPHDFDQEGARTYVEMLNLHFKMRVDEEKDEKSLVLTETDIELHAEDELVGVFTYNKKTTDHDWQPLGPIYSVPVHASV